MSSPLVEVRGEGTVGSTMGESGSRYHWLIGGVIVVVASLLRLRGLGSFALIPDELFTFAEAHALFQSELEPGIHARPLYYLLQHAAFWVLPETALGLRILPLTFGIAGVWMTWKLAREVFGDHVGLAAAVLVSLAPWHLHASGFGRYWSMVYLISVTAYYLLWRAYTRGSRSDHWAAAGALMVGLATHPTFAFPMIGAGIACCFVSPEGKVGLRLPTRRTLGDLWIPLFIFGAVAMLALKLSGNASDVRNHGGRELVAVLRLLPAVIQLMTPVIFAAGAFGMLGLWWRGIDNVRVWGILASLGALSGLSLVFAASLVTDVYADYAIAVSPLFYVSAAALSGLVAAEAARRVRGPAIAAWTAVIIAGMAPSTVSHFLDGSRFDPRPAFERITREAPDVPVVSWPGGFVGYYAPRLRSRERGYEPDFFPNVLADEGDIWVVMRVRRYGMTLDSDGSVARWLYDHCRLRDVYGRQRLDYREYKIQLYRCTLEQAG